MISQFFVLSARGDSIITKDFRGDIPRDSVETFFRRIKQVKNGDCDPVFVRRHLG